MFVVFVFFFVFASVRVDFNQRLGRGLDLVTEAAGGLDLVTEAAGVPARGTRSVVVCGFQVLFPRSMHPFCAAGTFAAAAD